MSSFAWPFLSLIKQLGSSCSLILPQWSGMTSEVRFAGSLACDRNQWTIRRFLRLKKDCSLVSSLWENFSAQSQKFDRQLPVKLWGWKRSSYQMTLLCLPHTCRRSFWRSHLNKFEPGWAATFAQVSSTSKTRLICDYCEKSRVFGSASGLVRCVCLLACLF